jgi:thiopeptide-type bacteriocin biosynthesis protein
MQRTWLSAHLFYAGDLHHLLRHLVIPLLHRTGYPVFFIRYWECGPHIRLRLHVPEMAIPEAKRLLKDVSQAYFTSYPSHRDDAAYKGKPLLPNNTLQFIAYEPEVMRYGNFESMQWAEQQFVASSVYILKQVAEIPAWTGAVALLHAIKLNKAVIYALQEEKGMNLDTCRRFINAWLPRLYDPGKDRLQQEQHYMALFQARFEQYAGALNTAALDLWKELSLGACEPCLQIFMEHNHHIFQQYKTLGFETIRLQDIIGSLMHMGHNRLGISNLDEAYIMFFTLKCLEFVYDAG